MESMNIGIIYFIIYYIYGSKTENIQLGQPSVNPPGLVLEAGGTSTLQA